MDESEPDGWLFILDAPDNGGVAGDFWVAMAERMERLTAEVWERDRRCIRSWVAGNPLMPMMVLAGRPIEDVCAGL